MSDQFGNDGVGGFDWQSARMRSDREEIERLRSENEKLVSSANYWKNEHLAGNAEIERLRGENKTFRLAQKACEHCDAPTVAEIERLRALLRECDAYLDYDAASRSWRAEADLKERVREALGNDHT